MKHFRMYFPRPSSSGKSAAHPVGRHPQVDRALAHVERPDVLPRRSSNQYVPSGGGFGRTESLEARHCRLACDAVTQAIAESDATQIHVGISILSDRRVAGAFRTANIIERSLQGLARHFERRGCVVSHTVRIGDNECNSFVEGLKITATLS